MAKTTLRQHILRRFHANYKEGKRGYANAQQIEDVMHIKTGMKHESIGRELRRMSEDGLIERAEFKLEHSKVSSVYYRYFPKTINTY